MRPLATIVGIVSLVWLYLYLLTGWVPGYYIGAGLFLVVLYTVLFLDERRQR
jgi:hypothetical protein